MISRNSAKVYGKYGGVCGTDRFFCEILKFFFNNIDKNKESVV